MAENVCGLYSSALSLNETALLIRKAHIRQWNSRWRDVQPLGQLWQVDLTPHIEPALRRHRPTGTSYWNSASGNQWANIWTVLVLAYAAILFAIVVYVVYLQFRLPAVRRARTGQGEHLRMAAREGDYATVSELIKMGACIDAVGSEVGVQAL